MFFPNWIFDDFLSIFNTNYLTLSMEFVYGLVFSFQTMDNFIESINIRL